MSAEKLLSIVIVGRNDDYLGNYRYRLQTCLDFLATNLRLLGRLDDVEVLFVDWNSQGRTLADEISVGDDAAAILRFVIVTPQVAKARNMQVSFFTTCAVNVGVRRASGKFIMLADSDSMMPLPSLKALLELLDGTLPATSPTNQLIFPIPRHQIPGAIAARRPNVAAWVDILKRLMASRRKELPSADCLGGFSAAQLMHRDLWWEFGGYNENLDRAWGWSDNELMFRVTQKYNWMDVGYYGVVAFHIEHFASTGNAHARDPNSINTMSLTYDPHPNGADWGLAGVSLPLKFVEGAGRVDAAPQWEPMRCIVRTERGLHEMIRDPEIEAFTSRVAHSRREGGMRDSINDDAIVAASTVLLKEYPRNVLHVGALRWPLLSMIVEGNPGADLFMIQPWKEGNLEGEPGDPGMLSMLLANSPYRGFARILSQRAPQAIDQLVASDPIAQSFDLAILDRSDVESDFAQTAARILTRLAPGGAFVLIDQKRRFPKSLEEARVFLGRLLSREADLRLPLQAPEHHGVFVQSPQELKLGAGYDVVTLGEGAVHLVRKHRLEIDTVRVAAE